MYRPEEFAEDRQDVIVAAMRQIQFACLVTAGNEGMMATHLPMVVEEHGDVIRLEGHFARANDHWKLGGGNAHSLAIFQGPQAYVHPGWYPSKQEHGKVVPTWNYIVAHAHGRLEVMDSDAELSNHLARLTQQNEQHREKPWATSDAPERYMDVMKRGIVGVRMHVERLEGKWKLSQNKSEPDYAGVIEGFGNDTQNHAAAIAEAMRMAATTNSQ